MSDAPALKEWFNAARYRWFADELASLTPRFDRKKFLAHTLPGLDERSLLQRIRRTSEAMSATLPADYPKALAVLKKLAPRFDHNFVTLVLPDFVGLYGHDDFDASMDALAFFTRFGSAEFAIREFLKRDLPRTLAVMERWSLDKNEHLRRLASEGCRPRLPWSFRLPALIADPSPVAPILENLRADDSLYVRKSVANHLNDITKDHPDWTLATLRRWTTKNPHTAWIARRALRTLIKAGHPEALALFGVKPGAFVRVENLTLSAPAITLGDRLSFSYDVTSTSSRSQRIVADYAVHYVKKSGDLSRKVFKLSEFDLPARSRVSLKKSQRFQNFTTRTHYAGEHRIELLLNGQSVASTSFMLHVTSPKSRLLT
ncbi:DNA alkylation repair protein [Nibricoccus aquaticus]|uniref:DNA alkylation repair protein n=1 Tax=Nibricoccus aquaticus TaxID=2576891 RepID=A0A290Q2F0_9BACT|nr:DNA alkylation repair protein [Nibricoccus aquaticus]ATC62487.1 DNA alkylation repair protein [Nibricoccus aquaticus]